MTIKLLCLHMLLGSFFVVTVDCSADEQTSPIQLLIVKNVSYLDIRGGEVDGIAFNSDATDEDLGVLGPISRVETLEVKYARITDKGIKDISHLTGSLKFLNLTSTAITDDGAKLLGGFGELIDLDLSFTEVGDGSLQEIGQLLQLKRLSLAGTRITGSGLSHLSKCKRLSDLDISTTLVDDAGLAQIGKVASITTLHLSLSEIKGPGIAELANCGGNPNRYGDPAGLSLYIRSGATDRHMKYIAKLPHLSSLILSDREVTDAGVSLLMDELPEGFRYIDLRNTKVSKEAIELFQEAHPAVQFVHDHDPL